VCKKRKEKVTEIEARTSKRLTDQVEQTLARLAKAEEQVAVTTTRCLPSARNAQELRFTFTHIKVDRCILLRRPLVEDAGGLALRVYAHEASVLHDKLVQRLARLGVRPVQYLNCRQSRAKESFQ
jgi:hypothetical protein